jgi:hypothetical protein
VAEAVIPAFPGSRPFTRAESGRFFGRTAEAAHLVSEWLRNPVTFLTGPAAIGKTSLLTAGILPFVENRRSTVSLLPVGRLSGRDGTGAGWVTGCPIAVLPPHNPYSLALLQSWSRSRAPSHLAGMPVDDFLREHALYYPDVLILAAIDQADDLFAGLATRDPLRRRFLTELAAAVAEQPRLRLLVSVRSACLPRFTELLGEGVQFHLDPLTPLKALSAAGQPGYFAPDAASALVEGVRASRIVTAPGKEQVVLTDTVEPALLQVACASLWQALRMHASEATLAELDQFGEAPVDAALTGYCSAVIAAVAATHEIPVDWLRTWLIDTFVTDVGELNTAPETAGAPATVVRALEDRYLLRGEAPAAGSGERRYQLLSARLVEPLRGNVGVTPETESVIVDIGDANPDEHLREAERARVMGEHDLANKIAAQVLRTVPGKDLRRHAEAHSLIGDVAYERGRLDEAESSYRTAISLFQACGQNAAVGRLFAAVARTFIDRGRLGEALDELAAAVNRVPDLILQDELVNVMTRLSEESARKPPFGPSAP